MQPFNKVIIRNKELELIVGKVVKTFARYAIYSIENLYSDYDQFQLASKSRNLITIKTHLKLMKMSTLCHVATNLIAYI